MMSRVNAGIQRTVLKRGLLDMSKGLTVTSDEALKLVEEAAASKKAKYDDKKARKAAEQPRRVHERAKKKAGREASELAGARARAQHFGDSFQVPRSLKPRRSVAAKHTAKNAAQTALLHAHLQISAMSSTGRVDSIGTVPTGFCQHYWPKSCF